MDANRAFLILGVSDAAEPFEITQSYNTKRKYLEDKIAQGTLYIDKSYEIALEELDEAYQTAMDFIQDKTVAGPVLETNPFVKSTINERVGQGTIISRSMAVWTGTMVVLFLCLGYLIYSGGNGLEEPAVEAVALTDPPADGSPAEEPAAVTEPAEEPDPPAETGDSVPLNEPAGADPMGARLAQARERGETAMRGLQAFLAENGLGDLADKTAAASLLQEAAALAESGETAQAFEKYNQVLEETASLKAGVEAVVEAKTAAEAALAPLSAIPEEALEARGLSDEASAVRELMGKAYNYLTMGQMAKAAETYASVPEAAAPVTEANQSMKPLLMVKTEPADARVRVMNIGPRYQAWMELEPGEYDIEVSANGYQTFREWITLSMGDSTPVEVTLQPE